MAEKSYHVIIIGAGAAGMSAAVTALQEMGKRKNRSGEGKVLLLESNDRVGRKILATGNGKCNFTHENIGTAYYHTDDQAVLKSVLTAFPTEAALRFFDGLGMPAKEKNGHYYPLTETASTVLDVLRLRLSELGCETLCSVRVKSVEKSGEGFCVRFTDHDKQYRVFADSLVLAAGSRAGGFLQDKEEDPLRIAKSLGLHSTQLYPALAKCICREDYYYRQLAGVRAQVLLSVYAEKNSEAKVKNYDRNTAEKKESGQSQWDRISVKDKWELLGQEAGELQLTKEGISGIAVFQLSGDIAQRLAEKKRVIAEINYLPEFREENLDGWAKDRLALLPGRILEEFFLGVLHKKILQVCLQAEGLRGAMRLPAGIAMNERTRDTLHSEDFQRNEEALSAEKRALIMVSAIMKRAMHFTTEVTAVSDMRQAQVCRGGLSLSQFDEKLECKTIPGFFACGEVLNVDGACGGYNLHFAWASGNLAGREAARRGCLCGAYARSDHETK